MEFSPPPEAPLFHPTPEEFKDPLSYIEKIRPIAEKTGICRIKPPPDWKPTFAVDVDNFTFTPRVQRLNELEASTRIKLNFLDQIAKFWELQGSSLRIPNVERKALDLHALHKTVRQEGGMEAITRERKWTRLALKMGYHHSKGIGTLLRQHYERILYPYDVFQSGASLGDLNISPEEKDISSKKDYVPHGIPSRQAINPPPERYTRRSKRHAGNTASDKKQDIKNTSTDETKKNRSKNQPLEIESIVCHSCGNGDDEANMLLCDVCDDSFHTFCLIPPLPEVPRGDWRCPRCLAEEVAKPQEAFGFEQAKQEYTLTEFGARADEFKSSYFKMPPSMVPTSLVEKEFWRIVHAVDEDVTVEYGADLHTMEHGSGFPTAKNKSLIPQDMEYAESGWNLNNLPILEKSVLRHINADISGMKVPWVYVGMCFATFCWHNEDHWSYSINYLHWGEPKTWYGVPGDQADKFEDAMKSAAPQLFEAQPDLLHHLVTIMNPNVLMDMGIPIFRTDQQAGEFVITFPRAYHAGFNQGFNFAEAVNFATSNWLQLGRLCVNHYSTLHRYCVFSHDELVCKMATDPSSLDITLARALYEDMVAMIEDEEKVRDALAKWNLTKSCMEIFELLPDDERQCDFCKTTCFLSAITCSCTDTKLVCGRHMDKLCSCPPSSHCLRYRYTLEELGDMLVKVKAKADAFDNWKNQAKMALHPPNSNAKLELAEFRSLIQEAEEFPKTEELTELQEEVDRAEKVVALAQQLLSRKVRTRNRHCGETKYGTRLTLADLQLFYSQLTGLRCHLKETILVHDLLERVQAFASDAKFFLEEPGMESKKIEKLLDVGLSLDIDMPEIPLLKQRVQQARWLEKVHASLTAGNGGVGLDVIRGLIDAGVNLPPHATVEAALAELQEILTEGERWEERAKQCLVARPRLALSALEAVATEAAKVPAKLPSARVAAEVVARAKEWSARVEALLAAPVFPYHDVLRLLLARARPLPVRLEQLPALEAQVEAARTWLERTSRTFLKKNSAYTLMEVLSPKSDVGSYPPLRSKKKKVRELERGDTDLTSDVELKLEDVKAPAQVVNAIREAEKEELEKMHAFRALNLKKYAEDKGDARYCLCRKGFAPNMIQCELCKEWYHNNCVPLPKSSLARRHSSSGSGGGNSGYAGTKFLCPLCQRSRRPRLEMILSLLVSLQKLPVRVAEGEALQCLTERAMSWQDRAKHALSTEELSAALAKLSVISQKMVEQAAREKTEKIISTELLKAASNPELQPHLQASFGSRLPHSWPSGSGSDMDVEVPAVASEQEVPTHETSGETEESLPLDSPDQEVSSNYSMEHAYSSASRQAASSTPGPIPASSPPCIKPPSVTTPTKQSRKSPLVPRRQATESQGPLVSLTEEAIARLEALMVEGDLLEVSLDESQHIWRILQAARPSASAATDLAAFYDSITEVEQPAAKFSPKKKTRKRKSEDGRGASKKAHLSKHSSSGSGSRDPSRKKKKSKPRSSSTSSTSSFSSSSSYEQMSPPPATPKVTVKREDRTLDKIKSGTAPKRVRRPSKSHSKQGKKKQEETLTTDDNLDYDEKCSASNCQKPTGNVNWVQCDGGCDLWFHLVCVGLSLTDISETEDYICPRCTFKISKSED